MAESYLESLPDLAELLLSERADVRSGAAATAVAFSGNADIQALLVTEPVDERFNVLFAALAKVIETEDTPLEDSRVVLSAILNFSGVGPSAIKALAACGILDLSLSALLSGEKVDDAIAGLHSGILANASRNGTAVDSLLAGTRSPTIQIIARQRVASLLQQRLVSPGRRRLPNLALLASNLAQVELGRLLFVGEGSGDEDVELYRGIVSLLDEEETILRLGAASLLRNLAMDTSAHSHLVDHDFIAYALVPLIFGGDAPDEDDLDGAPEKVRLASRAAAKSSERGAEPELEVRVALVEALLLLCKSDEGREALKKQRAYPVLRNLHRNEENERVREIIESIVDRTELLESAPQPVAAATTD